MKFLRYMPLWQSIPLALLIVLLVILAVLAGIVASAAFTGAGIWVITNMALPAADPTFAGWDFTRCFWVGMGVNITIGILGRIFKPIKVS